jgi:hypothetical protein
MRGTIPATEPTCPNVDAIAVGTPPAALGAEVHKSAIPLLHSAAPGGAGMLEARLLADDTRGGMVSGFIFRNMLSRPTAKTDNR